MDRRVLKSRTMSAISRRPAAFTLVELLVVIGVIVLLAALAFPTVRSAVSSAKSAEVFGG
jgi:prepilin-type N-terminal cleavage/methylation domain-containing protein